MEKYYVPVLKALNAKVEKYSSKPARQRKIR
jgi:hypothetical protein